MKYEKECKQWLIKGDERCRYFTKEQVEKYYPEFLESQLAEAKEKKSSYILHLKAAWEESEKENTKLKEDLEKWRNLAPHLSPIYNTSSDTWTKINYRLKALKK